ncbi:FAD/FMN-containing isoamyl alcohol oxidase-like protein MreA [Corynespora cassiicola Philippines]|uniref:FAD/FMN-containing isoamyl alcohol oxidase-like protein MreA n=1 Tax=Corynespora cassiicola Philippines TaxID=1448308 RepID=A0A2T2NJK9_CORCC|nr:FAD/FMN-containing isoamyl alcohol oxidase-like protein MreA [Corynespora cassiicola Philippines]
MASKPDTSILCAILLFSSNVFASKSAFTKAKLFDYETKQLTEDFLESLSTEEQLSFGFVDNAVDSGDFLPSGKCKVFPGDEDWPTNEIWDKFNELTDDSLVPTVPIAAPCYKNWDVYDEAKCAEITENYIDPYLHEADPTSNMWPIFQGRTCLPGSNRQNSTCTLGGFPEYAVNVSTVAHVQLAVNFARNSNMRLVIKNTGHCYLGKSLGAGSLSIWTHNLRNMEFIENYTSDSGYEGRALKIAAGVTVREVYQFAHEHNVTITGGVCESVGFAGGYIAGGGHTPMSGYYGMAADNVEALEVVTADGRFVTASNTSNPDLFWALRGGGGSTFGVVTSVIVRAHPKMPVVTSVFSYETGGNITKEVFWEGTRKFFELFIPFADAHTYTYFFVWPLGSDGLSFQMAPFFAPNHTIESFNELVRPWFDRLSELGIKFTPKTTRYDSFYPAYHDTMGNDTVGASTTVPGNRLFPRGNWEDPVKFEKTFAAIRNHSMSGKAIVGYHQAPQNRLKVDNAVSSAFRHVLSFLIVAGVIEGGEDATPAQVQAATTEVTENILGPWREVSPTSDFGGSYLNEANVMEPNWQESFYGIHYPRLLELKKKWDPKSVFYATTAVGSEEWEVLDGEQGTQTQNGRLCKI